MKRRQASIEALVRLLEDEDRQISTMAMEQLLRLGHKTDSLIAELQESHDPLLRGRIHQLASILNMRRSRSTLIENIKACSLSQWEGVLQISQQYNPLMRVNDVEGMLAELVGKLPERLTTCRLTDFMRNENFVYTTEDMLGADLYLIEDVLMQHMGGALLLSLLANEMGKRRGWTSDIVIYRGRHCLLDICENLIDPIDNWGIRRLPHNEKVHRCSKNEIWLTLLSQLFLAAITEGRLQSIYRVSELLAELCESKVARMPYPVGTASRSCEKLVRES